MLLLRARVNLRGTAIKRSLHSPKDQHYWSSLTLRLFRIISRILSGGVSLFCKDAVGVFHSPSQQDHRALIGEVLILCKDAVRAFYKPSQQGHMTLIGEFYSSAEMQSVYSTGLANKETRHSLEEIYSSAEMQSFVSYSPSQEDLRALGGVLFLYMYAIRVFCSSSQQGHRTLIRESYSSGDMLLV